MAQKLEPLADTAAPARLSLFQAGQQHGQMLAFQFKRTIAEKRFHRRIAGANDAKFIDVENRVVVAAIGWLVSGVARLRGKSGCAGGARDGCVERERIAQMFGHEITSLSLASASPDMR